MDTCVYANNMQLHFEIHEVPRLEHLVYDCAPRLSPLPASTYADEDMVGKIKQFALKSHPFRLGYQILQRYAAYCCCRWLRQLTGWFDGKFVWLYMLKKKIWHGHCYSSLPPTVHWRTCFCWAWRCGQKAMATSRWWDGRGQYESILFISSYVGPRYYQRVKGISKKRPFFVKKKGSPKSNPLRLLVLDLYWFIKSFSGSNTEWAAIV